MGRREHRYVGDRLSAYVDDELTDRERARVATHLATCEVCRADLRALRWTKDVLSHTPPVRVPRSFVVREVDVQARRPARKRPLLAAQWATAVVALLFVVVLGGDLLTGARMPFVERAAPQIQVAKEPVVGTTGEATVVSQEKAAIPEAEVPAPRAGDEGAMTPTSVPATDTTRETDQVTVETESQPEAKKVGVAEPITTTPAPQVMMAQPVTVTATPVAREQNDVEAPSKEEMPTQASVPSDQAAVPAPSLQEGESQPQALFAQEPVRPRPSVRLAWRVAEIALGVALIGLVSAVLWLRRRG